MVFKYKDMDNIELQWFSDNDLNFYQQYNIWLDFVDEEEMHVVKRRWHLSGSVI